LVKSEKVVKGSGADRVREYVDAAAPDAIIMTETVAKSLNLKSSTVSTALSRLTGKIIERVPGSLRGKFRKINRAA
jgi:Mn-dependent DtxR family transcriptional regulator